MVEIGTVIAQRYVVLEFVAEGGMGQLYKVSDRKLEGVVRALKVIKSDQSLQKHKNLDRESEAKVLTLLNHQGLPRIYDRFLETQDQDEMIVMDWVEGNNLEQIIRKQQITLTYEIIVSLGLQLIEAIHYLHQQSPPIIHRDIKSTNVMVDVAGQVKLIDFGISKLHSSQLHRPTIAIGTPGFASPEQMNGTPTDERSDIFSFGCILFYMCSEGTKLPTQQDLQRIEYVVHRQLSHMPVAFRQLILQCLQPERSLRLQHAGQVKEMLRLMMGKQSLEWSEQWKLQRGQATTIAVISLNPQAGATTIATVLAHHYANESTVKLVEYCGSTACFENIPFIKRELGVNTSISEQFSPQYSKVQLNDVHYYLHRSCYSESTEQAQQTFTNIVNLDTEQAIQIIDFSSDWKMELIEQFGTSIHYFVLIADPTIVISNERKFKNIQLLLEALVKYSIPYTWLNNKDISFRGRKAWLAISGISNSSSLPYISQNMIYSDMWSSDWPNVKRGGLMKLKKQLMPLIKKLNRVVDR